jgi:hypothetical protein
LATRAATRNPSTAASVPTTVKRRALARVAESQEVEMLAMVVAVVVAVLAAIALGWWLRGITSWCPHCGDDLVCRTCARRPGLRAIAPRRVPGKART